MKKLLKSLAKNNWKSASLCALVFITVFFLLLNQVFFSVNSLRHNHSAYIYYSSDILLIPDFLHNLLWQQGALKDWSLPGVTYLVPDIFLNAIIFLFSQNLLLNIVVYAILQIILYMGILALLFKTIAADKVAYRLGLFSGLISLLLLAKGFLHQELLITLLWSNFHFGQLIMALICLYFLLLYLQYKQLFLLAIIFLLSLLTVISDLVFIGSFCVPAAISVLFFAWMGYLPKKQGVVLSIFFLCTVIIGKILFTHLPLPYVDTLHSVSHRVLLNIYDFDNVLHILWLHFLFLYQESKLIAALWVLFIPAAVLSIYKVQRAEQQKLQQLSQFVLIFILSAIVSELLMVVFTDDWYHYDWQQRNIFVSFRHMQIVVLAPLFIGIPLLLYRHSVIFKRWFANNLNYIGLLLLLCLPAMFINANWSWQFSKAVHYYPRPVRCFDHAVSKYNLHAGIAGFWNYRPFAILNRHNTPVVEVKPNLGIYHWMNTLQFYRNQHFDFAVVSLVRDQNMIMSLIHNFGPPLQIVQCHNQFAVYVYTNGAMGHLFANSTIDEFRVMNHHIKR